MSLFYYLLTNSSLNTLDGSPHKMLFIFGAECGTALRVPEMEWKKRSSAPKFPEHAQH